MSNWQVDWQAYLKETKRIRDDFINLRIKRHRTNMMVDFGFALIYLAFAIVDFSMGAEFIMAILFIGLSTLFTVLGFAERRALRQVIFTVLQDGEEK